jgi:hypothetical protein
MAYFVVGLSEPQEGKNIEIDEFFKAIVGTEHRASWVQGKCSIT